MANSIHSGFCSISSHEDIRSDLVRKNYRPYNREVA